MEWQSLLDLGFLWAGRDYVQAGQWFQRSLDHTRLLDDPRLHARSLNRVGNWLINTGRVDEGLHAHQEALALFETLQDTSGMAETFDLLGMANGIYGDTAKSVAHYKRAIELLRASNDQQSLISSLGTSVAYICPFLVETTYSACEPLDSCSPSITEALNLARQADSLVSQSYIEWIAGGFFSSIGELGRGLAHAQESLRISTEIRHTQWMAGACFTLGRVYILLLEAKLAAQALEAGLQLACEIASAWWIGNITAYLARAYLLQGDVSRAQAALQAVMPQEKQPENSPERRMSWAWGEVALAARKPDMALSIADRLLLSVPGAGEKPQPIPWLLKLRGEALGNLSRREEALQMLEEARQGAIARQEQPLLWQLHLALGRQHRQLKQAEQAQGHFLLARQAIADLADTIDDSYLQEQFSRAALAMLPREKPLTASRAAKSAFGGLTEREREVAAFIAQGKSNREIAEELIVTKRTVETHINNILYKLDYTSRAQIIAWAIEKGLTKL